MKVGPNANFPVAVRPYSTEVDEETAHLYVNVFDVRLNVSVHVTFVPDISHLGPPWDGSTLPGNLELVTTVPQARLAAVLTSRYVVTPNDRYAGTEETFLLGAAPEQHGVVFYVTRTEFERYRAGLDALSEITGTTFVGVRVGDLREYDVITYLEQRVLGSAWLRPRDATLLGR
jgi:hypothetical protein